MAVEVVKKVKVKGPKGQPGFAYLHDDGSLLIEYVRFSHPHIAHPWKKDGDKGKPKYSVQAMLGKKTHAAAIELVEERIAELLKENKVKKLKSDRIFLRDGDDSDDDVHEGFMLISAREERRPPMRHKTGKKIAPDDVDDNDENIAEQLFVGGHWGAVWIRPWFQNSVDWGKRANCGLTAIQFLLKDETFGAGRLSDDDIDDRMRAHDDDDDDDGSYDDDDDDEPKRRPKKRRARDDDDDDDEPRRKPKKRRSRDDDDDDEDDDI